MNKLALALGLLVVAPVVGHSEDVWRWQDSQGKVHYSNVPGTAPEGATQVKTRITIEADRLPGGVGDPNLTVVNGDVDDADPPARTQKRATAKTSRWLPGPPRIYDDARLRFGCYAGSVLYTGGFSHADDIAAAYDCTPYRLGPTAWLNAARAELALRENGISVLDVMQLYGERKGD
jgi:hypothetical protein